MACMEKLKVINSQIGLSPAIAAPTAMPAKPCGAKRRTSIGDGQVNGADAPTGAPSGWAHHFRDRRVDDALLPEALQQTLADFVSSVVLTDFLQTRPACAFSQRSQPTATR